MGPQTADKGSYRFSLRKATDNRPWNPKAAVELVNGEKVSLWCHSLGLGGWKSLDEPPLEARRAFWNKETKVLEFETAKAVHSAVGGFEPAVFKVEFV